MEITIRQVEPADAEAVWKCYTAPQVVRNTMQLPYRKYAFRDGEFVDAYAMARVR